MSTRLLTKPGESYDLDQLHHRHRVHEVHADDLPRAAGVGGQARDGYGAGVAGEDGVIGRDIVELLDYVGLEILVLGHRLDDEVAALGGLEVGGRVDTLERRVLRRLVYDLFLDLAAHVLVDTGEKPLWAKTWAIPLPIVPPPTTATFIPLLGIVPTSRKISDC